MMKRKCIGIWLVALMCLLVFSGCNGTSSENAELKGQVDELKGTLSETEAERDLLKQDIDRLKESLGEAEVNLADVSGTKDQLTGQVQNLQKSREELDTKVDGLTTARVQLQQKIEELSGARGQLQQRVDDLAKSRGELQHMVENLVDTRGLLEKQIASLSTARDAARTDAKMAQTKIEKLGSKLKIQTQQMTSLQDQIVSIRSVLSQLQEKLE
jgi:chromosome segregation ATPase